SRPVELGRALGKTVRELRAASPEAAARRLRDVSGLDERAVRNLLQYLEDQAQSSALPDDRTIVVERFRDELGDWRVCVLTPRSARAREVRAVVLDTDGAPPFAASLLFDHAGQYLYEGDAPLAEGRAQALTLGRELLAELLGTEELRELLDLAAIAALELELQG